MPRVFKCYIKVTTNFDHWSSSGYKLKTIQLYLFVLVYTILKV